MLATAWRLLGEADFRADIGVTLLACALAFAIVAPLALASGFVLGETPAWERRTAPALALLMTTPKSVFLPVFILMLGIGFAEKIIFAVALAYFIVVPTGLAAAKSVPRGQLIEARARARLRLGGSA